MRTSLVSGGDHISCMLGTVDNQNVSYEACFLCILHKTLLAYLAYHLVCLEALFVQITLRATFAIAAVSQLRTVYTLDMQREVCKPEETFGTPVVIAAVSHPRTV